MKIINRKTFLSLPQGILYSKYKPCVFSELQIKGETGVNSWMYQDIVDALDTPNPIDEYLILTEAHKNGNSIRMDFSCEGRDGCYDEDQLFAIWERKDLEGLIERLGVALKDGYGERNKE